MPRTQARIVGSGFTAFSYAGQAIAFLDQVQDSGQRPAQPGPYQTITPIGHLRPVEIVTQRVLAEGTMTLTITELWNQPVWWHLQGLANTHNIGDVFDLLRQRSDMVTCQTLIKPPGAPSNQWRGKNFHNCVVTVIPDGDTITAGGLTVAKNITIAYTHSTPIGGKR